jgi:Phosphotransferase enzyme family
MDFTSHSPNSSSEYSTAVKINFVNESPHLDAVQVAHKGVIGEYEAYTQLSALQGTMIPQFFGMFLASFAPPDLPASCEPPSSRNIYVILIEKVLGTSLDKLNARDPERVPPDIRDRIMDEVFEIKAQALTFGLIHNDFAPRNVILRAPEDNSDPPALVLIDFEKICVVKPQTWDPSPAAREKRIAKLRATPDIAEFYGHWPEAGWLV